MATLGQLYYEAGVKVDNESLKTLEILESRLSVIDRYASSRKKHKLNFDFAEVLEGLDKVKAKMTEMSRVNLNISAVTMLRELSAVTDKSVKELEKVKREASSAGAAVQKMFVDGGFYKKTENVSNLKGELSSLLEIIDKMDKRVNSGKNPTIVDPLNSIEARIKKTTSMRTLLDTLLKEAKADPDFDIGKNVGKKNLAELDNFVTLLQKIRDVYSGIDKKTPNNVLTEFAKPENIALLNNFEQKVLNIANLESRIKTAMSSMNGQMSAGLSRAYGDALKDTVVGKKGPIDIGKIEIENVFVKSFLAYADAIKKLRQQIVDGFNSLGAIPVHLQFGTESELAKSVASQAEKLVAEKTKELNDANAEFARQWLEASEKNKNLSKENDNLKERLKLKEELIKQEGILSEEEKKRIAETERLSQALKTELNTIGGQKNIQDAVAKRTQFFKDAINIDDKKGISGEDLSRELSFLGSRAMAARTAILEAAKSLNNEGSKNLLDPFVQAIDNVINKLQRLNISSFSGNVKGLMTEVNKIVGETETAIAKAGAAFRATGIKNEDWARALGTDNLSNLINSGAFIAMDQVKARFDALNSYLSKTAEAINVIPKAAGEATTTLSNAFNSLISNKSTKARVDFLLKTVSDNLNLIDSEFTKDANSGLNAPFVEPLMAMAKQAREASGSVLELQAALSGVKNTEDLQKLENAFKNVEKEVSNVLERTRLFREAKEASGFFAGGAAAVANRTGRNVSQVLDEMFFKIREDEFLLSAPVSKSNLGTLAHAYSAAVDNAAFDVNQAKTAVEKLQAFFQEDQKVSEMLNRVMSDLTSKGKLSMDSKAEFFQFLEKLTSGYFMMMQARGIDMSSLMKGLDQVAIPAKMRMYDNSGAKIDLTEYDAINNRIAQLSQKILDPTNTTEQTQALAKEIADLDTRAKEMEKSLAPSRETNAALDEYMSKVRSLRETLIGLEKEWMQIQATTKPGSTERTDKENEVLSRRKAAIAELDEMTQSLSARQKEKDREDEKAKKNLDDLNKKNQELSETVKILNTRIAEQEKLGKHTAGLKKAVSSILNLQNSTIAEALKPGASRELVAAALAEYGNVISSLRSSIKIGSIQDRGSDARESIDSREYNERENALVRLSMMLGKVKAEISSLDSLISSRKRLGATPEEIESLENYRKRLSGLIGMVDMLNVDSMSSKGIKQINTSLQDNFGTIKRELNSFKENTKFEIADNKALQNKLEKLKDAGLEVDRVLGDIEKNLSKSLPTGSVDAVKKRFDDLSVSIKEAASSGDFTKISKALDDFKTQKRSGLFDDYNSLKKEAQETDRLVASMEAHRDKLVGIVDQIKAYQKDQKEINPNYNSVYSDKAISIIERLIDKYQKLIDVRDKAEIEKAKKGWPSDERMSERILNVTRNDDQRVKAIERTIVQLEAAKSKLEGFAGSMNMQGLKETKASAAIVEYANAIERLNKAIASNDTKLIRQTYNDLTKLKKELEAIGINAKTFDRTSLSLQKHDDALKRNGNSAKDVTKSLKEMIDHTLSLNNIFGQLGTNIQNAFSVVGIQQFARQIINIGGEIEKQRLAMNSILGGEDKSTQLYGQLSKLSMISPFSVEEVMKYSKQLAAFGIEYEDLYDTTKRLADIAAGVGVDFGRIAYEFGQTSSRGWLDARELRMFANSGIPLLQQLSEFYSQQRNQKVSTTDVRGMISKREVGFEDVKSVLWQMTDEGGKFFNMQEIMAESLAAKYRNLSNAWNLMLAELAQSDAGDGLKKIAEIATKLTQNWGDLYRYIRNIVTLLVFSKIINSMLSYNAQVKSAKELTDRLIITKRRLTLEKIKELAAANSLSNAQTASLIKLELLRKKYENLSNAEKRARLQTIGFSKAQIDAVFATNKARRSFTEWMKSTTAANRIGGYKNTFGDTAKNLLINPIDAWKNNTSILYRIYSSRRTDIRSTSFDALRRYANINKVSDKRLGSSLNNRILGFVYIQEYDKFYSDLSEAEKRAFLESKNFSKSQIDAALAANNSTSAIQRLSKAFSGLWVSAKEKGFVGSIKSAWSSTISVTKSGYDKLKSSLSSFGKIAGTAVDGIINSITSLGSAMLSMVGWMAAITAVTAAWNYIDKKFWKLGRELKEIDTNSAAEIAKEERALESLKTRLDNVIEGSEEYQKIKDEIFSKYGEYLDNYTKEETSLEQLKKALDGVTESYKKNANAKRLQEKVDKVVEHYSEDIDDYKSDIRDVLSDNFNKEQISLFMSEIDKRVKSNQSAQDIVKALGLDGRFGVGREVEGYLIDLIAKYNQMNEKINDLYADEGMSNATLADADLKTIDDYYNKVSEKLNTYEERLDNDIERLKTKEKLLLAPSHIATGYTPGGALLRGYASVYDKNSEIVKKIKSQIKELEDLKESKWWMLAFEGLDSLNDSSIDKAVKQLLQPNEKLTRENFFEKLAKQRDEARKKVTRLTSQEKSSIWDKNIEDELNQAKRIVEIVDLMEKKFNGVRLDDYLSGQKKDKSRLGQWKDQISLLKDIATEYQKWEKIIGADAAEKKIKESGLFQSRIEDYQKIANETGIEIPVDLTELKLNDKTIKQFYEAYIEAINKALEKASPSEAEELKNLQNTLRKDILELEYNKTNQAHGNRKDSLNENLKNNLSLLKDMYSEYEKFRKLENVSDAQAGSIVMQSEMFKTRINEIKQYAKKNKIKFDFDIEDFDFTKDKLKSMLDVLKKEAEVLSKSGTAEQKEGRLNTLKEVLKEIQELLYNDIQTGIEKINNDVQKKLDKISLKWDFAKSIRVETSDLNTALSAAFGSSEAKRLLGLGINNYSSWLKNELISELKSFRETGLKEIENEKVRETVWANMRNLISKQNFQELFELDENELKQRFGEASIIVKTYLKAIHDADKSMTDESQKKYIEALKETQTYLDKRNAIEIEYSQILSGVENQIKEELNAEKRKSLELQRQTILLKEQRDLAKNDYETWKNNPETRFAFDNLANSSAKSLDLLSEQLVLGNLGKLIKNGDQEGAKDAVSKLFDILDAKAALKPLEALKDAQNDINNTNIEGAKINAELAQKEYNVALEKYNSAKTSEEQEAALTTLKEAERKRNQANTTLTVEEEKLYRAMKLRQKAMDEFINSISKLGNSLSEFGNSIGGSWGEGFKLGGDTLKYLASMKEGMSTISKSGWSGGGWMNSGSAIISMAAGYINLTKSLGEAVANIQTSMYERAVRKQAEINELIDVVWAYKKAVMEARQEEEAWFGGTTSHKSIQNASEGMRNAFKHYTAIATEAQEQYLNKSGKGWGNYLIAGLAVAAAAAVTYLSGGAGGAAMGYVIGEVGAMIGSATGAAVSAGVAISATLTGIAAAGSAAAAGIDAIIQAATYASGKIAAINNLLIETREADTGFWGTGWGGHDQETQGLQEWLNQVGKIRDAYEKFAKGLMSEDDYNDYVYNKIGGKNINKEFLKTSWFKDDNLEKQKELAKQLYLAGIDNTDLFDKWGMVNVSLAKAILENESLSGKLVGETKETLQKLTEVSEEWQEYQKQLKDAVSQMYSPLMDTMVEAIWDWFDNGADALDVFKNKASDVFRDIASDMLKTMLQRDIFQKYVDDLSVLYTSWSNPDYGYTDEMLANDMAALTGQMVKDAEQFIPFAESWTKLLDTALKSADIPNGLTSSDTSSGMTSSIKGVTEETAEILAAYINGMRLDLSVQRSVVEQIAVHTGLIASVLTNGSEAQLAALQAANASVNTGSDEYLPSGELIQLMKLNTDVLPLMSAEAINQTAQLRMIVENTRLTAANTQQCAEYTQLTYELFNSVTNGTKKVYMN